MKFKLEKKRLKNLKSQAHIEMVISFVIFLGFLLALLFIFNPVKQNTTTSTVIETTQTKILNNISFGYSVIPLILNASAVVGNCFSIDNTISAGPLVFVKDLNYVSKKSLISSSKIYIESSNSRYYSLYYNATSINQLALESLAGCTGLPSSDYSFGLVNYEKVLLMDYVQELNKSYITNYSQLKSSLGINNDFAFIILNETGDVVFDDTRFKPKAINVYSRSIPVMISTKNLDKKKLCFYIAGMVNYYGI